MSTSGIIKKVFDPAMYPEWEKYFKKWTKTGDHTLNCYGIDKKNQQAELWFQNTIFNKVKEAIGISEMQSIFGMYAESVNPYTIHTDEYHVRQNGINGKPCISWLIPYKVDHVTDDITRASTIIFNEQNKNGASKKLIDSTITNRYFQHCDDNVLNKLSIDKIIHWEPGSLIWWDMRNYHCSGSFDGFTTKEMFVGHTFIAN
jgi:hypothetical protein